MTEGDLEPLRQARERMGERVSAVLFRKMQRGTLDREDTPNDLEIRTLGRCLVLTKNAYDEMATAYGLPTLRERQEAWKASFPLHDPDDGIPF